MREIAENPEAPAKRARQSLVTHQPRDSTQHSSLVTPAIDTVLEEACKTRYV